MDSESNTEKPDPYPTPKLPLFSIPPPHRSKPSGISTPPLQTTVSVPFHWEQQPGIPKPCTDIIITKCLHLPPRLLSFSTLDPTKAPSPSPTTLLHGPEYFFKERRRRERSQSQKSFDGQKQWLLGPEVEGDGRQVFGSFRFKGKCKVTSSSTSATRRKKTSSSVSRVTGSRFWVKIYEGFKRVIPWRKKSKIECFSF